MAEFHYVAPSSVETAVSLLQDTEHPALLLAGGTRLLPDIRANRIQAGTLIDLRYLASLKGIRFEHNHIEIGARTTLAELERSELLQEKLPLLTQMSRDFANPLIRSSATIGGNIASRRPIADAVVPLLALNAMLSLQAASGETWQRPLASFLTVATPHTPLRVLITRVNIPIMPKEDRFWFYHKLSQRKAGAPSIASVALAIIMQEKRIKEVSIALGAITSVPTRATQTEAVLLNEPLPLSDQIIERCLVTLVADLQDPRDDFWATAMYRVKMGQALVKKALTQLNTHEKVK